MRTGFGAQEPSGSPGTTVAVADADIKRTASEAVLRVVDKHALPRRRGEGTAGGGGGGSDGGGGDTVEAVASSPAVAPPPASSSRPPTTATPTSAAVILERASILAEALCVWKYFGLPLAALEASLRPQLDGGDGVRVLTALFFPQLSRDCTRNGAPSTDPLGQEAQRRARGGGREGQTVKPGGSFHDLGLSPQFYLALTMAAGKPAVLDSATSSYDRRSAAGLATSSGPSPLTLLLEHQAGSGGGSELGSAWVRLGATPGSASAVGRRRGRVEVGSDWPPAPSISGARTSYSRDAAAATAAERLTDTAAWFFSCGHRFPRRRLLESVVPASASSVRQATASLERTQQVLALEYDDEGRSSAAAGAACPECAAKELVRLAAVAGSSLQARGMSATGGNSSPPPPQQRLLTQERPRVR